MCICIHTRIYIYIYIHTYIYIYIYIIVIYCYIALHYIIVCAKVPPRTLTDLAWLRANGVNTNGAAAKVTSFNI